MIRQQELFEERPPPGKSPRATADLRGRPCPPRPAGCAAGGLQPLQGAAVQGALRMAPPSQVSAPRVLGRGASAETGFWRNSRGTRPTGPAFPRRAPREPALPGSGCLRRGTSPDLPPKPQSVRKNGRCRILDSPALCRWRSTTCVVAGVVLP